jgi:hypothetical protein
MATSERPATHRSPFNMTLRSILATVLLSAGQALAGEPSAPSASTHSPGQVLKRLGSDTMSAGRELGGRFAEAGRRIGHGARDAAKRDVGKIASDVKTRNFAPRNNGRPAQPQGQGSR